MQRLHARYPFLEAAREAVNAADVDLAALVAADGPVVQRATERVEACLREGTVGEPHRDARTELLSYPVARVLVSLIDRPVLIRRYATAEATAAGDRFRSDLDNSQDLESVRGVQLTLDRLLTEFDLSEQVRETDQGYRLAVGKYLMLSEALDGDHWELRTRQLDDGTVPVTREELLTLLGEAVRRRVAADLPMDVPDPVATELDETVEYLEGLLADRRLPSEDALDAVVPELFPPCIRNLLERARAGADLSHHARFALVSFLGSIGLEPDDIAAVFADPEPAQFQAEHVRGEYPLPSCETMQALGDCVPPPERDDRCATIDHPLTFYADALDEEWSDGETDPTALIDSAE